MADDEINDYNEEIEDIREDVDNVHMALNNVNHLAIRSLRLLTFIGYACFRYLKMILCFRTADNGMDAEEIGNQEEFNDSLLTSSDEEIEVQYDTSLPYAHQYLSSNSNEVHGRAILDDYEVIENLQLIALPNIVLMPGQILPLHQFGRLAEAILIKLQNNDECCKFGVINSRIYLDEETNTQILDLSDIGTTAEIISYEDCGSTLAEIKLKTIGRERFKCIGEKKSRNGVLCTKVIILPDILPPCLFSPFLKPIHKKLPTWQKRKFLKDASLRTNIPYFLYEKQYDMEYLRERIVSELTSWHDTKTMPKDFTSFSFWGAQNLPVDDVMKLKLLKENSVLRRLRMLVSIIDRWSALLCSGCGRYITSKRDIFSMSVSGPLAAYVNPNGHIHDTITTLKSTNIHLIGRSTSENSWFPGFAWTIAQCRNCNQHLGWKFTTTKKNLKPEIFWGLTRSSLVPGLTPKPEEISQQSMLHNWQPML